MNYNYDEVYPYDKLLQEVKELLLPTITEMVNPLDAKKLNWRKEDVAEIIYTQVMALAYNDENINASLIDLMPIRNQFLYPEPEETAAVNMAIHLCIICKDYSHQLRAFKVFHQMTKELKSRNEIIREVEIHLLPLTL